MGNGNVKITEGVVVNRPDVTMLFNEGDLVVIKNAYMNHLAAPNLQPFDLSYVYRVYSTYYVESDNKFFEERQMTVIPLDYVEGKPKWKDQEQSKWMLVPKDKLEELRGQMLGKELGIL